MVPVSLCAVIPVYNHGATAVVTVKALIAAGVPCVVIDDGSDAATKIMLQSLREHCRELVYHRLEVNQGKGGAVMAGLALASEKGFSHAMQIDADGQHSLADVPKMKQAAEKNPQALIVGQPEYDESVPKGRMLARYITHFWVGVELLSFRPPDTMCGYRIYPLKATLRLLESVKLGRRMDFDTEIMVRLMWRGVALVTVLTKVIYPKEGISHFNYVNDNMRISWMHTKLFFGMLLRSPILLGRKVRACVMQRDGGHWSEIQEVGAATGITFLLLIYKVFGKNAFKIFLYPVILYFFASKRSARKASLNYLDKVYAAGSGHALMKARPGLLKSYHHFIEFGCSAIDRVASWSGKMQCEEIVFAQRNEFINMVNRGKGGIIFGAHLGNIELCRGLVEKDIGAKINILMFTEHAQRFNSIMKKVNVCVADRVIPVNEIRPDTAILLQEKVQQGEIIVILADRTAVNSNNRINYVNFFGQKAAFGQGPFIMAALLACPVYLMFCLKRSEQYHAYFEPFVERVKLPRVERQEALQAYIQQYASRLEYYCKLEPYQWFNFYDYWAYEQKALNRHLTEK